MAKPETPHRPATPPYPLPHRDHDHDPSSCSLEKFRLFETQARFYLIGCDRRRRFHRVLKIDRSERSDLHISEDPVVYTEQEVKNLLHRIAEGNRSTGGLTAGGTVYGIAGCIKFLESYYLILVTKRRQVGAICGHAIYSIEEIQMITVPHSSVQSDVAHCKVELRYKKLLSSVDLTKDFYYSYTYPIMQSLQMNMRSTDRGGMPYENMFVWNAYLTEAIRSKCGNTMWTIALIHGDFQQVRLSTYGREFIVTIIARRSRHFAGTRYLKRGVNDRGWVANDVETEQIVINEQSGISEGKMSSVVQVRGSIPLFWSQEASRFSPKPDIILQRYDPTYQATKLHFEDLSRRYGNPIIVLNLIKTVEKRPREMILRREFASAVGYLNQILPKEKQLRFIHWDFHKFAKSKSANVLAVLGGVASEALDLTGLCYSGKPLPTKQRTTHQSQTGMRDSTVGDSKVDCVDPWKTVIDFKGIDAKSISEDNELLNKEVKGGRHRPQFQSGVLRTNCIDCLDRTNVAQYAYGLAALGCQLHAMGLTDTPKVDPDSSIATNLMDMYQSMGDALAHQYGGSAAHNTVFPERQGKWKATTQSREFIKSIRRYYSNTYTDGEKQDAINLFLGYFKPQEGKPALWELDSDYYLHVTNIGVEPVPDSWKSSSYMPSDSEETEITALVDSSFLELRNSLAPIPACKKDFTCLKLTSFEKLLNTTGGSVKNVRLCSESETKTGGIGGTSRMAPDAAEIQLKTPNWLYGQRKYEEIAVRKTMDTSEEATAQDHFYDDKYWNLGWLSRSDNEDEDIFKRYLMMASDDGDEIWFGGKLLFCQDESSEAYMHYAAFCQGHAMKPFQEDKEKEEHYRETLYMGHDCDADDALVKANMESALENCSHIGEDLGIGISCRSLAEDPCYLTRWIIGEERIQVKGG